MRLSKSEYDKKRYSDNHVEIKQRVSNYRTRNPHRIWATNTIRSHKKDGYDVTFTISQLTEIAEKTKCCPICNCILKFERGKGYTSNSPTLDRINNDNHMNLINTWIICRDCNMMKGELPMKEFVEKCKMISDKFGGD